MLFVTVYREYVVHTLYVDQDLLPSLEKKNYDIRKTLFMRGMYVMCKRKCVGKCVDKRFYEIKKGKNQQISRF